jgi:hypothetical protein
VEAFEGFVRGLAFHGQYAFIAMSKIRKESKTAKLLPVADIATRAGIIIYDLKARETIGMIEYTGAIDEIYDVQVVEEGSTVALVSPSSQVKNYGLSFPDKYIWSVPKPNV